MKYISTRGRDRDRSFTDVLLAGLALDGGLYVPDAWPVVTPDAIRSFKNKSYADVAFEVIRPFVAGTIEDAVLHEMAKSAYSRFSKPEVAPLSELSPGRWLLELYHGPTLAFKDIAMQFLARLMDHVLAERGMTATVIGATSGDTGGAAVEAFRGLETVRIFILHPHGRVSDVQRRQMTCVLDDNVRNIALEGTFDDTQAVVKSLFNNRSLRDRLNLSGVNSINWARVMAQIVYYFTAAARLGAPERAVSFTVPTGNFGDIYAGYAAKRMGLPVERLVIATNVNDILVRMLDTGGYETGPVVATTSPSMDIQISSNFERLLFDVSGRDAGPVDQAMDQLGETGKFQLDEAALQAVRSEFDALSTDEAACARTINEVYRRNRRLIDPHTAVGVAAAGRLAADDATPMVCLATAHPAKFPDAVEAACGERPHLPDHLADLFERPERYDILDNDPAAVENYLLAEAGISGAAIS